MNCDQLDNSFNDCCQQILASISDLKSIIVNGLQEIDQDLSNINSITCETKDFVTIDISGTVNSEYSCQFPLDEDGNTIPTYAETNYNKKSYHGVGLAGIHEQLKIISTNLDAIHNDSCKGVDPFQTITLEDMYNYCDNSTIKRSDFSDDEQGQKRYLKALDAYFLEAQKTSKYGNLIADSEDNNDPSDNIVLIEAPTNWTTHIMADFALIQGRINRNKICSINIPEPADTVTLVASEKELHRIDGKLLILHFVTLENYPKRSHNSSYRPIQIPGAKDSYDWNTDFVNLRWQQGNQYAELVLKAYKHGVSGWFASVGAADAFFDAVLNLTTAIETNRLYPIHKTPKTNIPNRSSRPYRAFISKVDDQGNATTLTTYFPLLDE